MFKGKSSVCKYRSDGANQVTEKPEEDDYALFVKCGNNSSGVVDLCGGGMHVETFLFDSGATCKIVHRTK